MEKILLLIFLLVSPSTLVMKMVNGYSDKKPHQNQGILQAYSGEHLPYTLTVEQINLLGKNKPVIVRDEDPTRDKGRAAVIQDIHAPPAICLKKILDFTNYPKYVSFLKKLDIYHQETDAEGNQITSALFDAGVLTLHVGYYLRLVVRPHLNTLTWTLDYTRKSDFEDNIGHWQVMPHPTDSKMSRVLYSTEAVLPKWVPSLVVNYIIKTVLVEATTWLKRESEKEAKEMSARGEDIYQQSSQSFIPIKYSYVQNEVGGATYTPLRVSSRGDSGEAVCHGDGTGQGQSSC